MPECYKIRDTRTGLFSTGVNATLPAFHCYSSTRSWDRYRYFKYWTLTGKAWNDINKVKQHLSQLGSYWPKQWEILRFEAIEDGKVNVTVVELPVDALCVAPATIDFSHKTTEQKSNPTVVLPPMQAAS